MSTERFDETPGDWRLELNDEQWAWWARRCGRCDGRTIAAVLGTKPVRAEQSAQRWEPESSGAECGRSIRHTKLATVGFSSGYGAAGWKMRQKGLARHLH